MTRKIRCTSTTIIRVLAGENEPTETSHTNTNNSPTCKHTQELKTDVNHLCRKFFLKFVKRKQHATVTQHKTYYLQYRHLPPRRLKYLSLTTLIHFVAFRILYSFFWRVCGLIQFFLATGPNNDSHSTSRGKRNQFLLWTASWSHHEHTTRGCLSTPAVLPAKESQPEAMSQLYSWPW